MNARSNQSRQAISNFDGYLFGQINRLRAGVLTIVFNFHRPKALQWFNGQHIDRFDSSTNFLKLIAVKTPLIELRCEPAIGKDEIELPFSNRWHQFASD